MTQPCPEELLVRARRETLSEAEHARLEVHLAHCEACSAELKLGAVVDRALGEQVGDDLLAARLATHALRNWGSARRGVNRGRRRALLFAMAAALVTIASVATAAFWHERGLLFRLRRPIEAPSQAAPPPVVQDTPLPLNPPVLVTEPSPIPNASDAAAVAEPPITPGHAAHVAAGPARPTADQLFGRANDARHKGDTRLAISLYRSLQQEFPGAGESKLSCVLLGRTLLLNEVNDPAGALAQFDAYLASSPKGTLTEEALSGRGRALERLGREREARDAWKLLLDRFPESIYAAHARQQLGIP